ncbi:hypothetical protein VNO80_00672 [Phaseolus coccineus]|uniref:Uncharacterized protein n=1 Tax=Phaseolus coccineus TaxID=3886 RepID=A0AAN9NZ75_PHACN
MRIRFVSFPSLQLTGHCLFLVHPFPLVKSSSSSSFFLSSSVKFTEQFPHQITQIHIRTPFSHTQYLSWSFT